MYRLKLEHPFNRTQLNGLWVPSPLLVIQPMWKNRSQKKKMCTGEYGLVLVTQVGTFYWSVLLLICRMKVSSLYSNNKIIETKPARLSIIKSNVKFHTCGKCATL